MKEATIIQLIEDFERLKKFVKDYIKDEGLRNFEVYLRMRAMERVLSRIPMFKKQVQKEMENQIKELNDGKRIVKDKADKV